MYILYISYSLHICINILFVSVNFLDCNLDTILKVYKIQEMNWYKIQELGVSSSLLTGPGSKEALWTCEKDSKARACQQVPRDTCKFDNIENLISKADLEAMKKVKITQQSKRFQKWLNIAKKGTFCSEAFCTQHLKMCLSLTFQSLSAFGCMRKGAKSSYLFMRFMYSFCKIAHIFIYLFFNFTCIK